MDACRSSPMAAGLNSFLRSLIIFGVMAVGGMAGTCGAAPPVKYGVILFPSFEPQDVIGPVDPLQILAFRHPMDLYVLAATLDPVTTGPNAGAPPNPFNSSFWPVMVPTHTFADAPDLDVLIVPGGPGARNTNATAPAEAFIRERYPQLQYLITICTGATLAARSGVLDGKRATTNKGAWAFVTAAGPKVKWVAPARWIVDGNVWSSSGVTAGLDLIHGFIRKTFGDSEADRIAGLTEYIQHGDSCDDPWAPRFNVSTVEKCVPF